MYFEPNNFEYFICYLAMFAILYLCGAKLDKDNNDCYSIWFIAWAVFTINEGFRFDRGVDYMLYMSNYDSYINNTRLVTEPGWHYICYIIGGLLQIPWPGLVIIMSGFLFISGAILLKRYKGVLRYALPLFAFYSIFAENLARWFLAFSFVLIALYYLETYTKKRSVGKYLYSLLPQKQKKYKYLIALVFFALGFSVHYGIITFIFPAVLIKLIKKPLLSPIPSVLVMLIIFIFYSPSILGEYVNLFSILNIDNRFDNYQNSIGDWIKENDEYRLSPTDWVISFYFVFTGYKTVLKNRKLTYFYNVALIGTILAPAMRMLELSFRINYCFTFFQFLFLAFAFRNSFNGVNRKGIASSIIVLLLIFKTIFYNSFANKPSELLYIWDLVL